MENRRIKPLIDESNEDTKIITIFLVTYFVVFFITILLFDIYLYVRLSETWEYIVESLAMIFGFISSFLIILPITLWIQEINQKKNERKRSANQIQSDNSDKNKKVNSSKPYLYKIVNNYQREFSNLTCVLCKQKIENCLKIGLCPQCNAIFHLNHLEEWIEENDNCPICQFEVKKKLGKKSFFTLALT